MAKSFMGSLVIAPVELPPQALPASMRRVAFAAKDLLDNPTPKTAARLAEARLGTVVHPFGGAAFLERLVRDHKAYGEALGITAIGQSAPPPVLLREPLLAARKALRSFVLASSAHADDNPEDQPLVDRLLRPIAEWQGSPPKQTDAPALPDPSSAPATPSS